MSSDDLFPFPPLFDILKFTLERRLIEYKAALKDIGVILSEPEHAHLHPTMRDHKAHFERQIERLKRAIPYVLRRRERERD